MAKTIKAATSLFPLLPAPAHGLARCVEEAKTAQLRHLVEFRTLEVRSILNRSESKRRLSLAYSINPYRGCEFGCRYCYARYTHEFLAPGPAGQVASEDPPPLQPGTFVPPAATAPDLRNPDTFEQLIFLKQNAAWLLEQELRRIDPAKEIALGTATDPYQPVEREARITRSLLEVFARRSGHRLGIVTKSALITRDLDLLQQISRNNTLVVHLTITTADASLARKLEPRAPRPELRFDAVARLRQAGIRTGVLNSPLLPGITDNEPALDAIARQARKADASFLAGEPLFLKPCSRPTYLSFVREHFPALEAEYAARFAHAEFASRPYRQEIAALLRKVCRRHGLSERSTDALLTRDTGDAPRPAAFCPQAQQRLFA